jgi:hypothetical protein
MKSWRCSLWLILAGFSSLDDASAQPPDTLWTRTFGTNEGSECASSVLQLDDLGFIAAGTSAGVSGTWDLHILATDQDGNLLWEATHGTSGQDHGYGVAETGNGYLVAGYTDYPVPFNVLLMKFTIEGSFAWIRIIDTSGNDEIGYDVISTPDGGCLVAGADQYLTSPEYDAAVFKMDSLGYLQWERTYRQSSYHDIAYDICATADGGYALAGVTYTGPSSAHFSLIKIDPDGAAIFAKGYGVGYGQSVCETSDGCFAVAGFVGSTAVLMKTDSQGNLLWRREYGTAQCRCVRESPDGGFLILGYKNGEIYLFKTDADGYELWQTTYSLSETGSEEGSSFQILPDPDAGLILTGGSNEQSFLIRTAPLPVDVPSLEEEIPLGCVRIFSTSPNPVSYSCTIQYSLPFSYGRISVSDTAGREVASWDCIAGEDTQSSTWDGTDSNGEALPNGVYILRLTAGGYSDRRNVVVLR